MRLSSYEIKAKLCHYIMKRTKFYIGERCNYDYVKKNFWDAPNVDKQLAAIYDASYVRYKTIEFLADEVKEGKIEGEVAELGVYKGQTSYALSLLFPEKKMYLFDTFEGFNMEQVKEDIRSGYSTQYYDLRDTDEKKVLEMMPNRDKCIIKKGLFPNTAFDVEESFCFVSIDVDLYQPIYDGLNWFYPRLKEGGYIIIHDYNNSMLKGVKNAVRDYEAKHGLLKKCPIVDLCGSLVVTK